MSSGDQFGDDRRYEEKYAEPDSKPQEESTQNDPVKRKAEDRDSMFDQVLEVTKSDRDEPLSVEELKALTNVAKQHRQKEFQLNPVAIDLVGAILRLRLNQPNAPKEYWDKMSIEVASTLCDAPKVKARLKTFWQRLVEAVS